MKKNGGSSCGGRRAVWGWVLLLAAVWLLHQDCWNWLRIRPLILGVLPVGLAYHAAYALVCSGVMALLVRFAWPRELERMDGASGSEAAGGASRGETDNRASS
jgi:hypothetical protein